MPKNTPLFKVTNVEKTYKKPSFGRQAQTVLSDVNLEIQAGDDIAIVGESGSGKSTLLRVLLGVSHATSGTVEFMGERIDPARRDTLLALRRSTGVVLQDPGASFNPRRTAGQSVTEPLDALQIKGDRRELAAEMFTRLGLPADSYDRYPHEFSGGQQQRLALARALIHKPQVLITDEPLSAVDVLMRESIVTLLQELRAQENFTMLTVTHDLRIVPALADRILVIHNGQIAEDAPVESILNNPQHPHTISLTQAVPRLPLR